MFLSINGLDIYKVNNGTQHGNWTDFFYRIIAHNTYFKDTFYELIGFTLRDDQLAVVLKQPVVDVRESATYDELKNDLEKRGFEFKGINEVIDHENGVILRDLHRENAVVNTKGNIYYLDPIIQFLPNSNFIQWLESRSF